MLENSPIIFGERECMISAKVEDAVNEQINAEQYSAHLYLAIAAYFSRLGLSGFANWFCAQAAEENSHAMQFFDFLVERGGTVKLMSIQRPEFEECGVARSIEFALEHERFITSRINALCDLAISEGDRASLLFFHKLIREQVQEEAQVEEMLAKLRIINGTGSGLFFLDSQMGKRKMRPQ